MTKRVLSLLLTLVMVLSLGVPALAADEFEAEAPAEVVEEAPAAPVEPEAPEAEVVEEPAAEEAEEAVEAPEIAMAIAEEPEDQPMVIATELFDDVASETKLQTAVGSGGAETVGLGSAGVTLTGDLEVGHNVTIDLRGDTCTAGIAGNAATKHINVADGVTLKLVSTKSTATVPNSADSTAKGVVGANVDIVLGTNSKLELSNVAVTGAISGKGSVTVTKATVGGAVKVEGNITASGTGATIASVEAGKGATVDLSAGAKVTSTVKLQGSTLNVSGDSTGTNITQIGGLVTASDDNDAININGGDVKGIQGTNNKKVTIFVKGGIIDPGTGAAIDMKGATGSLTIEGGTLTRTDDGPVVTGTGREVEYSITGGTFVNTAAAAGVIGTGLQITQGYITGGRFVKSIDANKDGAASKTKGEVPVDVASNIPVVHFKSDVKSSDSTDSYGAQECTIVGETMIKAYAGKLTEGTIEVLRVNGTLDLSNLASGVGVTNLSTGKVTTPSKTLDAGDTLEPEDGYFQVGTAVSDSLTGALLLAGKGGTVTLRKDAALSSTDSSGVTIANSVTLNTNGHTLKLSSSAGIEVNGTSDNPVTLTLVAEDGINEADITVDTSGTITVGADATLDITNNWVDCAISAANGSVVVGKTAIVEGTHVAASSVKNLTVNGRVDMGSNKLTAGTSGAGTLTVNEGGVIVTSTATNFDFAGKTATVAGTVSYFGSTTAGATATISGKVEKDVSMTADNQTLTITGEILGTTTFAGSGATTSTLNIKDGAKLAKDVTIGNASCILLGSIEGGEFSGAVAATYKSGSSFAINNGEFKAKVSTMADASTTAQQGINGGIFNNSTNGSTITKEHTNGYVAAGKAVVTYTDPGSLPTGMAKNSKYHNTIVVGNDAAKTVIDAAIKNSTVKLLKGDLALDAIADNITVQGESSPVGTIKMGGVTFKPDDTGYSSTDMNKLVALVKQAEAVIAKGGTLDQNMKTLDQKLTSAKVAAGISTASDLTTKINELKAALQPYGEVVLADKTALNAAITAAKALKEANYTEATWEAFEDALEAAEKVAANANALQNDVNDALKALTDAQAALKEKPATKETLQAAIKEAAAYEKDDYTAETWSVFADALAAANTVAAKDAPTEAEIKAVIAALQSAIAGLEKKGTTPVQPTVPAAPATNDRTWLKGSDGTWYCYINKQLQKSTWIYSKGGLWYYVDKDGKMLEGFQKIDGVYYFLQNDDTNGTRGTIVTSKDGWIYNAAIPGGCAYARNVRNTGHFGEITWTQAGGDFVNGHFVKGDPA